MHYYPQPLRTLAGTPLLIFDDWLRDPLCSSVVPLPDRFGPDQAIAIDWFE